MRNRLWYAENPEWVREKNRRYNEKNREKIKESGVRYRELNKEKVRERKRIQSLLRSATTFIQSIQNLKETFNERSDVDAKQ